MKAILSPNIKPTRGAPVEVGNVYSHPHGKPVYKIVLGVVTRTGNRPWANVVLVHIAATGCVVGSSNVPEAYLSGHNDLVGKVKTMPTLKIEWLKCDGTD